MSEKKCPDCGGDLWIVDGEYDTHYDCKDPDCRFTARSDAEYELSCDQKEGDKVIDQLRARVAELEAANRWIPVSERLPEAGQRVLMWIQPFAYVPGDEKLGAYMPMLNSQAPWRDSWVFNAYKADDITHWRPLPEPPTKDGQP
jgi:hypothetical protein